MKHRGAAKIRLNRLIAGFSKLGKKDQMYLEALTTQLEKIHQTSPETRCLSGKISKL